jgi:serine protease
MSLRHRHAKQHLHLTARLRLEPLEDRIVPSGGSLPAPSVSVGSTWAAGDILVQFRTNQPKVALAGTSIDQQLALVSNLYEINLSKGVSVAQAVAAYRAASDVKSAQPDYTLHAASIPNDPLFGQQWDLQNTGQNGGTPGADIGATQAWNTTTGASSIIVAIADTGIDYNQPDLYQNIWINQADIPASRLKNLVDVDQDGFISMADLNNSINQGTGKITDLNGDGRIDAGDLLQPMILNSQGQDTGLGGWVNPNSPDPTDGLIGDIVGWNFSANNNNPYDSNDHGTYVAGVMGAMGNNGTGIAGVDWNVQMMPIKFLDASGNGTVSQYIAGLNYAVAHGAKIVNNSWTGADPSAALTAAIQNAQAHGVIFVAAAGNSGTNNDSYPVYPANYSTSLNNVVTVAATDHNNNLAGFSDYGPGSVTLAAPGVNIPTTTPGTGYTTFSGTSAATPIVSGVLALVWSEHPSWTYTQVINQVLGTVTKVPSLAGKVATGGIVNAAAAVGTPVASNTPPVIVSATASGPSANSLSMIQLTFSEAINPATFGPSDVSLLALNYRIPITSVTPVAGSGNTVWDIVFGTQTAPGKYTLYVGSNAQDMFGNRLAFYSTQFTISG